MAAKRNTRTQNQNNVAIGPGGTKRPFEGEENNPRKKRVFGDITNRENNEQKRAVKKGQILTKKGKTKTLLIVPKPKKTIKTTDPAVVKAKTETDTVVSSQSSTRSDDVSWDVIELSQESKSSQDSNSSNDETVIEDQFRSLVMSDSARKLLSESEEKIDDVDTEHLKDPFQCSLYSHYIFNYYKERETKFVISDYIGRQDDLTAHMRGILVDWLVEVQENFELNHETLYLAIKIVDLYLNSNKVAKDRLQLIGATALFIACKFDERLPPILDDFLYICDDAYKRDELLKMEQHILKTLDFDLGIPLSYRFLRRYSKCARSATVTLTLARYILETSQMDYSFVQLRDSLRAAAALLLALKMDSSGEWTPSLVYYTGYTQEDLMPLVQRLNTMMTAQPKSKLTTIRTKYSHRVFHEVAKIPSLDSLELASQSPRAEPAGTSTSTS